MPDQTIFDFLSFREFFRMYIRERKVADKTFSYERISRATKIKSASQIASYAVGRRVPTPVVLHKLCDYMKLSVDETEYAQALVAHAKTKDPVFKASLAAKIESLRSSRFAAEPQPKVLVDHAVFEQMSAWYFPMLLQMFNLADFRPDPQWMSDKVGGLISVDEIKDAMGVLRNTGLLKSDEEGRFFVSLEGYEVTPKRANDAVRHYHSAMAVRGVEALKTQGVSERKYMGLTFAFDAARLDEAYDSLLKTMKRFDDEFESKKADDIYQLNIQLFSLTPKRKS